MLQDIIRLTVQRIFNDKILFGLLIVCLLGFFVGGFNSKEEPSSGNKIAANQAHAPNTNTGTSPSANESPGVPAPTPSSTGNYPATVQLEPGLAVDFVKWWMKAAMDYSPQSAAQSHEAAINWMTPEASRTFQETFWPPELAQQIASGATVGAFQPISVTAEAINPDHTIVVNLTGTLVLHGVNERPIASQVQMDLLVHKGNTGLRITGMNNRISTANSSIY